MEARESTSWNVRDATCDDASAESRSHNSRCRHRFPEPAADGGEERLSEAPLQRAEAHSALRPGLRGGDAREPRDDPNSLSMPRKRVVVEHVPGQDLLPA